MAAHCRSTLARSRRRGLSILFVVSTELFAPPVMSADMETSSDCGDLLAIAHWPPVRPMTLSTIRYPWVLLPTWLAASGILLLMSWHGSSKALQEWAWLDIVGEGGTALLILCWLTWVARSRPGGRVTALLLLGLSFVFLAMWSDTLDEFIRLPDPVHWDRWLESATMPVGLLLLTAGIYHWHQEQLAINIQMHKRERLFREHRYFDALIPLTGAGYLRRQLQRELKRANAVGVSDFALVVLDLNRFTAVNREHGYAEGDRILQAVSQLLLLNLRQQDLLCRLAGDRFVALLPATSAEVATQMAEELASAVASLAYRTQQGHLRLQLTATVMAVLPRAEESVEQLLTRLGQSQLPAHAPTSVAFA